jgi:hypothetical protein
MNKVYQTIVDKGYGNCMQAAFASLFEVSLENVPDLKKLGDKWFSALWDFLKEHGYEYDGSLYNYLNNKRLYPNDKSQDRFHEIKNMPGINGYFYATVYSPKYYNPEDKSPITHAVIIDKNFNIVHHVNKEYDDSTKYPFADEIGYNGILTIYMINPISK